MRLTFRGIDSSWLELRLGTFLKHFTSLVYETKIQEVGLLKAKTETGHFPETLSPISFMRLKFRRLNSSWIKLRLGTFLKHCHQIVYETNIQEYRLLIAKKKLVLD
jgi:hypothetical protein